MAEKESEKIAALPQHPQQKPATSPTVAPKSPKLEPAPTQTSSKKVEDLEQKKETKKTALLIPPEKKAEKAVKTVQASEPLKSDHTIEIAVFPWRFNILAYSSYADTRSTETLTVNGLSQVLNEYQLVVPKFSYYDVGNAKNIRGNPITEAVVNDLWSKKGLFSKDKMNLDLIYRLGSQLQVDAVLIYSIFIDTMKQNADITLIEIQTKKAYSRTEQIYVKTLNSDIKRITENFFIDYVSEKYKSNPNYEEILWEFIKDSQNRNVFEQYLKKFPDGTFAGLAKLRIQTLSLKKS
jgi:hypothetical protein